MKNGLMIVLSKDKWKDGKDIACSTDCLPRQAVPVLTGWLIERPSTVPS